MSEPRRGSETRRQAGRAPARREEHESLWPLQLGMLESLAAHRLLSTRQLHSLHTPAASRRFTRLALAPLLRRGLVERVRAAHGRSLWFLSEKGTATLEVLPGERRARTLTPEQAAGPLQRHTLAVNEVGVAFVSAARSRGDDCSALSWRHEVAHVLAPARPRVPAQLLIADALLTYVELGAQEILLHRRFIELDRGTAPAHRLAAKIARYGTFRHGSHADAEVATWRTYYRTFPHLVVVLADQDSGRLYDRLEETIALYELDPARTSGERVPVSFVSLDELTRRGPFAPIFIDLRRRGQRVDWLGEAPVKEG